jgi:RNA polymerase-binding transcription factor DksA
MAGYEEMAALAAEAYGDDDGDYGECERCGERTGRDVCRKCALVEAVEAA